MNKCRVCGREYVPNGTHTCGAECNEKWKRRCALYARKYRAETKALNMQAPPKPKSTTRAVLEIAAEAAKAGMSYGAYVARKGRT